MSRCYVCGKETELYDNGRPVCLDCEKKLDDVRSKPREPQPKDSPK